MFSPYYAWTGRADPRNHCAINVGIYGRGATYWAMTERSRNAVNATPDALQIGPSALAWDGQKLTIEIDELTAPIPRRVRGKIVVEPTAPLGDPVVLDYRGMHRWWPAAPISRVSVDLSHPDLKWNGYGYMDSNRGDEPLEDGVKTWTWSRVAIPGASAGSPPGVAVLYDLIRRRDESRLQFGLRFNQNGDAKEFPLPPTQQLPTSLWRMKRAVPSERGHEAPRVLKTAEDSPFYTRSIVQTTIDGDSRLAMHESLNMDRFNTWWMKSLMPVRMPRRFG